ncbi:MAG: nucleotidyltransferase domain-containing protein [Oscillospiraceae bacterium]|nr:nucleotidyltransferase domain-containing protein [Oscillospiraceae bacterium]
MIDIKNMNQNVKMELERYVSFISKIDGVIQIYLFGSHAYGTPTEESDIDLLVVVHDGIDSLKIMRAVSAGLLNRRVSLDVLVDNLSEFTERSKPERVTLQREIKSRGVLVYG